MSVKKRVRYKNPIPTVDVILEYKDGIILIQRGTPPFKNKWAITGGHVDEGLSVPENAVKETKEETNLDIKEKDLHLIGVYSRPGRDPRPKQRISITYYAKAKGKLNPGSDAKNVRVFSIKELKNLIKNNMLAFDHAEIMNDYLKLKNKK